MAVWHSPSWQHNSLPLRRAVIQGEERCGKIAAISAGTAETFWVIDEISGRMSDQGQALDSSQRIGETFARTGGISGKIIGISGTIAKTGETYGTT